MARTVAIIGAGQIGYAAAKEFLHAGWDIQVLARTQPNWDTSDFAFRRYILGEDPSPNADLVFDTIAYDEDDVARYDPDRVGRYMPISSASVYCDDQGRTLDEGLINDYPEFAGPITEDQTRISPSEKTYSTRKVRMENAADTRFGERATILRPCAIYGEHSRQPREWWFVKRLRDGRSRIPLAYNGESQFDTTDVAMIGRFAVWAAEHDLSGAFNLADANSPTVAEIGQTVADCLGMSPEFLGFDGPPKGTVGASPWAIPKPFTISSEKAKQTGLPSCSNLYEPSASIEWLKTVRDEDWKALFPVLVGYGYDLFDYEAEDRFLDELA
jgi:nucleoside-diphosphate-sugar epimerase